MCVAFLFLKARGDASRAPAVVLCVNRDEAFGRPTLPSHWWEDAPDVFAGRDLEAMGTWCGVSRTGRVAVLTNYTEPTEEGADATGRSRPSRGALAADFLKGPTKAPPDVSAEAVSANAPFPWTPSAYAAKVAGERDAYAGFNLIVGDCVTGEFAYVGNRGDAAGDGSPVRLDVKKGDRCSYENVRAECAYGGACGVSNAALGAPWPKVVAGAARLADAVAAYARDSNPGRSDEGHASLSAFAETALRRVLQNDGTWRPAREDFGEDDADAADDRRDVLATRASAFVAPGDAPRRRGAYGTRCSTVVAVSADKKTAVVVERTLAWSAEGGGSSALGSGVWSAPKATAFAVAER